MSITINAIIRNERERSGILAVLSAAGIAPMAIRTIPAGMGRLLRPGSTLRAAPTPDEKSADRAHSNSTTFMTLVPIAGVGLGLFAGLAGGLYVVLRPDTVGLGFSSGSLLIAGLMTVGWAAGSLLGILLRAVLTGMQRRHGEGYQSPYGRPSPAVLDAEDNPADEPILLAITAEDVDQAMVVETLLVRNGAQEVHLGSMDT